MVAEAAQRLYEGAANTRLGGGKNHENEMRISGLLKVAREESKYVRDDSRRPRGRNGQGKRNVAYGSGAYGGASSQRAGAATWGSIDSRGLNAV